MCSCCCTNSQPVALTVQSCVGLPSRTSLSGLYKCRRQFVKLQDCVLELMVSNTRAPQGTALSPFSFSRYMLDIHCHTSSCHSYCSSSLMTPLLLDTSAMEISQDCPVVQVEQTELSLTKPNHDITVHIIIILTFKFMSSITSCFWNISLICGVFLKSRCTMFTLIALCVPSLNLACWELCVTFGSGKQTKEAVNRSKMGFIHSKQGPT